MILGSPEYERADGSEIYNCPTCHGKRKLEVNTERGVWYCHKCGRGGRLRRPHPRIRGKFPGKSLDLAQFHRVSLEDDGPYLPYLKGRGLTNQEIMDLRPHLGPSVFRIYVPVYRLGETLPCWFLGRAVDGVGPPYMSPPFGESGIRKSDLLWGLHRLSGPLEALVLCEGVFDAVHDDDVSGWLRMALMGKYLSQVQAETIEKIGPDEVILMLDGDARQEAAQGAATLAKVYEGAISVAELPPNMDPDEQGDCTEVLECRERVV